MPIPDGWEMAWGSGPNPGDRCTTVGAERAGTVTGVDWWTRGNRVVWDGDSAPTLVWAEPLFEQRPASGMR